MNIVGIILYATLFPLILWGTAFAHKKLFIDRKMKKMGRGANPANLPAPLWPLWWKRLRFTFTDPRQISFPTKDKENPRSGPKRKIIYWGLYIIGFIFAIASMFFDPMNMILLSFVFFLTSAIFGIASSNKLLKKREADLKKMFSIASARLGIPASESPSTHIQIADWYDPVSPSKITVQIPTNFSADGEENFMRQFNQVFGRASAWVPDSNPKEGIAGWDYEKGVLTMRSVPPLPRKAPWEAKYVLHPAIAWCFFPLALGVENGVQIQFEEGQPPENILGIDFSGEQQGVGTKNGAIVADSVTRAPMALVAGGTGGGKAMSVDTPVLRFIPKDSN